MYKRQGIKIARKLLIDLAEMGIPAGHEYLDLISPQYISDVICWGAIGARTTESQSHRELASGLSCPVGFKNGTDGGIQIAVDAIKAASKAHNFLSVTKEGKSAIFSTTGNKDCHIILRGGKNINYQSKDVSRVSDILNDNSLPNNIMIDASHANSQKDHTKQRLVVDDIVSQINNGNQSICGVMLESNLVSGRQDISSPESLVYGQSIIARACSSTELIGQLMIIFFTPATFAGITFIKTVDGYDALPAGTYTPTEFIGVIFSPRIVPSCLSDQLIVFCCLANLRILDIDFFRFVI